MSKANLDSTKSNLERIKVLFEELKQILDNSFGELQSTLKEYLNYLGEFDRKANNLTEKISFEESRREMLRSELNKLQSELEKLTHKKDVLTSEISSKQQDIDQLSNIILDKEKIKTEHILKINSYEERLKELNRKIEENIVLINATKEDTQKEQETKKAELTSLQEEYRRTVTKAKALKYLIKKDLINLPEVKVIKSLTVPGVENEKHIRKTAGVNNETIRKVLLDLDRRGVIAFDPLTGKIQVLTKIDL